MVELGKESKEEADNGVGTSSALYDVGKRMEERKTAKMTVIDIFRHKRMIFNAAIIWTAWLST